MLASALQVFLRRKWNRPWRAQCLPRKPSSCCGSLLLGNSPSPPSPTHVLQVFLARNPELVQKLDKDLFNLLEPTLKQEAEGQAYLAARSQAAPPPNDDNPCCAQ